MSAAAPSPAGGGADTTPPAPAPSTGSYSLVGSYQTVQVLSPTLIQNVVYCTIQTQPSGVIAALPVPETAFDGGTSGTMLGEFAAAIESVMEDSRVIAGTGSQTIDDAGLLTDNVIFTVQYIDPVRAPNGATAQATVGVGQLVSMSLGGGVHTQVGVQGIIDAVYANLQAAAGG